MKEQKKKCAPSFAEDQGAIIKAGVQTQLSDDSHENNVCAMTFFWDRSTNSIECLHSRGVMA